MEEFESDDEEATTHISTAPKHTAPSTPHVNREPYVDADGVTMEWDVDRQAYFPKIDEDFANQYYASSYKANSWVEYATNEGTPYYYNPVTQETTWTKPEGINPIRPVQPTVAVAVEAAKEEKAQPVKRKAEKEEFFELTSDKNTFVYVTGLPDDVTEDEFCKFMQKCGIIAIEPLSEKAKVKIYRDDSGVGKGDGRCCYQRVESVKLAIDILSGSEIRPGFKVTVTLAEFKAKEKVAGATKKSLKNTKDMLDAKKKAAKKAEKSLAWFEDDEEKLVSKKVASVVIFKHMFDPKEFDIDATALTDIKSDMEAECGKFGLVKKRHPEGVISVRFRDPEAVPPCIKAMNGRFFGGKRVVAVEWDGHTNYTMEETEKEREERIKNWEKFLKEDA